MWQRILLVPPIKLNTPLLYLVLYPKLMVGWDCRTSTEKEVIEYVGILKI